MRLGPTDGIVLGMRLGLLVGLSVVGLDVGEVDVGLLVGLSVLGLDVGVSVGLDVVGVDVGLDVVGLDVGLR